ncbi:MAG TPA: glycosyltransferase 87 family protein, partial [Nannocystaceae bacterium]|nr:glycosyltransferase 87 family protein [Nannocystaceae bacterium]
VGAIPVAAIVGAAHIDWTIHATSGLETSMLAAVVTAGFVAIARDVERPRPRGWPAGLWLGLAALVRPDAALFAVAGAVAYLGRAHRLALVRFAAAASLCVLPAMVARWLYYGTLVPNTYLAKSAGTPWWDQGVAYLGLYLQQYAASFVGLPLALVLAWRRRDRDRSFALVTAALALAVVLYGTAVVRVGGDFMFARLFVPLTPLLALLLERGLVAAWPGRSVVHACATAAVVLAMHLSPRPVDADRWPHGVADEWAVYDPAVAAQTDRDAAILASAIEGVPVRIAFLGGMARVIDGARVPWAVDAETGLTDRGIASKPLARRGRPGHEKRATVDELLDRRVHLVIGHGAAKVLALGERIPLVAVRIGEIEGFLVHWDPPVVEGLRAHGLAIPDFPGGLDRVIASLPGLDDAQAAASFAKAQRFYFDWVDDPKRRAAFVQRLAGVDADR